ncbi:Glucan endo-1,3-beta-glucosidase 10 [Capsicum baccatum]|uniref:Glucan endo-1,3-beta-glucosidase 10 n=1 Tax=Capsicum baccatum TaxID=33114 RepID=A0A2G2WEI8_CAPBA|nr:Glucan endo-1,3-beta-glucosidase 10 [Capsicum baccatum]
MVYRWICVVVNFSTDLFASTLGLEIGINYGQIANNLPTPSRVLYLLRSLNVTRVKLYDADRNSLLEVMREMNGVRKMTRNFLFKIVFDVESDLKSDMERVEHTQLTELGYGCRGEASETGGDLEKA